MVMKLDQEDLAGHVLVADDDSDFRRLLVRRVVRMGLTVVEAENGDQAIEAIGEHAFDVLVVDLYMPGRSGLEVVHAGRRADPGVQAIVLTGSASVETAVEALRAGAYDYLTKPLESLVAFELSLRRALQHRHLVKENARLFAEVQRLAMMDPLTGLYNRHKLNDALEMEIERAGRYGRPLSAIMIDLDGMKRINDTHGHRAGDEVLRQVAVAIGGQVRRLDIPTRYGGDEFLVLLPEADLEEALRVAERVCAHITRIDLQGEGLSVSAGVAQWAPTYGSAEDFLEAVDQALYQAKRAGGQRVFCLPPEPAG
jgi:diguanylate cyclase (GGDEF)-like protein